MRIEVTQEDIARGLPRAVDACPVALAVKRAFLLSRTSVGSTAFTGPGGRRFALPAEATEFIRAFDKKLPVQPIAFDVDETLLVDD